MENSVLDLVVCKYKKNIWNDNYIKIYTLGLFVLSCAALNQVDWKLDLAGSTFLIAKVRCRQLVDIFDCFNKNY